MYCEPTINLVCLEQFQKQTRLDRLTLMAYTGPVITEVSANFLQE